MGAPMRNIGKGRHAMPSGSQQSLCCQSEQNVASMKHYSVMEGHCRGIAIPVLRIGIAKLGHL
jgi:hypothetical protein